MVTLKDVAARCGVSISTVSRVMNGVDLISAERAEFIRKTALEMGYLPNAVARTLKTNRSWVIGVLYELPFTHAYYSLVLEEFRARAEKAGFDVLFLSRTSRNGRVDYSDQALSRYMDGIAIVYADFGEEGVGRLLNGRIPVVSLDDSERSCSAVMTDYRKATARMVREAFAKGHRKIAFLHGEVGVTTRLRMEGYADGLREAGLPFQDRYQRLAPFGHPEIVAGEIREMLAWEDRPDCILLSDDYSARAALRLLEKDGIRAPRDFSCMGFDGIPYEGTDLPALTTWRQDISGLAGMMMDTLLADIGAGELSDPACHLLPGEWIPGETLGQPGR